MGFREIVIDPERKQEPSGGLAMHRWLRLRHLLSGAYGVLQEECEIVCADNLPPVLPVLTHEENSTPVWHHGEL